MRTDPPSRRLLAPLLFVVAYGLLALAWAMAQPDPLSGRPPDGALRADRLDDLALWLLAVALATALAWRPAAGSLSLAGIAVALTPGVVFLGGAAGGDGLVFAAGIAVLAGAARIAGDERRAPWTFAATALAAVLLGLGAPELAGVGGPGEAWEALGSGLATAVGGFGAGSRLPPLGLVIWALALLALVLAADRFTDDAGRRLLWSGALVTAVAALLLYGPARAAAGETPYARHALALLAFTPVLAGDLLARTGVTWWPRLGAGCFGLLALVQLLGFLTGYEDARGDGTTAWVAAALLGGAALAAAGALTGAGRTPSAQEEPSCERGNSGGNGGACPQPR
ncbi:hypothetical protein [Conexibacter arvalis]|uniref:MFS family permease n=1 Tax=Conexibacter arvalis TaxID=912552 RepID=A0A840IAJ3_9ACTN|nr:hypothetical protein [Conexibacter arvalis]MBB4661642.1 MFS family permease [Conexibacter arvalis]